MKQGGERGRALSGEAGGALERSGRARRNQRKDPRKVEADSEVVEQQRESR
jgi:hypothetical protein